MTTQKKSLLKPALVLAVLGWILVFASACSPANTMAKNTAATPMLFANITVCLRYATEMFMIAAEKDPASKAAAFCQEARDSEVTRSTNVANATATAIAANAVRDQGCFIPGGCIEGGGWWAGSRYYQRRGGRILDLTDRTAESRALSGACLRNRRMRC